jgi:hypothetical protein
MTTHHKDDCPCGSGKRYKHCHMASDGARKRRLLIAGFSLVGALVVGVAAWGAITQWQAGRAAGGSANAPATTGAGDVSGATAPAPSGAFGSLVPGRNSQAPIPTSPTGAIVPMPGANTALAPGEKAVPWQYDVAKNRHYDPRPGHQHWHNGPPPADTSQAVGTTTGSGSTVTVGGGSGGITTSTSMQSSGNTPLAPGENPAPWEYDQAKNRHFDPRDAHRHWHSGPPPAVSERGK